MAHGLLIPALGYQSHINVDRRHKLIRTWTVTHAAAHDGARLPELLDPQAFGSEVWADTAYRFAKNEAFIASAGRFAKIHSRRARGKPPPAAHQSANRARSKVRGLVEHVFAEQKERIGLFVRTVGLGRARTKIDPDNIAYNIKRWVFPDAQRA